MSIRSVCVADQKYLRDVHQEFLPRLSKFGNYLSAFQLNHLVPKGKKKVQLDLQRANYKRRTCRRRATVVVVVVA